MASIAILGSTLPSPIGCWSGTQRCYVARMDQAFRLANRVLGTSRHAAEWLAKPAYGLNWRCPCQALSDGDGYLQVVRYLERIEFGVY